MRRQTLTMAILASVLALVGCGSGDDGQAGATVNPPTSPASSTSVGPSAPLALVGEWQRLQRCSELARVMNEAGLQRALLESIAGDGWIPGVSSVDQIKDPRHPCRGSVARKHSHFFTEDGQFGSRDAHGQQVDDGPYRLVGDDTIVIGAGDRGGVTFHYKISDDDTLYLTPVIPDCAPDCFEAGWSIAVAYPGFAWRRAK